MLETQVQSLGQEDPLEKEMATHSSTLAWKIPWMEEPCGLQTMGPQSRTWLSNFTFSLSLKVATKLKTLAPWKKNSDEPGQRIKKQRHHFAVIGQSSQSYGFSGSHVQMWELDRKEGWAPKNWCSQTVVLEKIFESFLDCKEIKPVTPKGNKTWIFTGRTNAKTEAPIPWPTDAKSQLIGKDPDAGKDWRQEEKGTTEDEMVGWHHRLNRHEFEKTLGDSEGTGNLVGCSPWGCKKLNTT